MSRRDGFGADYWKLWTASVISNFGDGIGIIAYPWLASALTRNPLHIAGVALVSRLPWLLFALPAGVVTDRVDRRRLVAGMDMARFGITLVVALVVVLIQSDLGEPDAIADGTASPPDQAWLLLIIVYLAALLLGIAEVFRDNAAQTFMPALVDPRHLERANGRLWSAEMVMNSFVGAPVAGVLLGITFATPFFVDAGTFAVAAALVMLIAGDFRPARAATPTQSTSFTAELREGVSWLWRHDLFRPMAVSLGALNGLNMLALAAFVLFAQEILELDATRFGLLTTGFAVGGIIGSLIAASVIKALGRGASLLTAIVVIGGTLLVQGFTSSFWMFWAMGAIGSMSGVVWNVITVSLRQSLIPDHLLGRVNSVYRFLGWGMMPIGSAVGGAMMFLAEPALGRDWALRLPFVVAGALTLATYVYALPRLGPKPLDAAVKAATTELEQATADPGTAAPR